MSIYNIGCCFCTFRSLYFSVMSVSVSRYTFLRMVSSVVCLCGTTFVFIDTRVRVRVCVCRCTASWEPLKIFRSASVEWTVIGRLTHGSAQFTSVRSLVFGSSSLFHHTNETTYWAAAPVLTILEGDAVKSSWPWFVLVQLQ